MLRLFSMLLLCSFLGAEPVEYDIEFKARVKITPVVGAEPGPVEPEPTPDPPAARPQPEDLVYVGAFRVPRDRGFSLEFASMGGLAVNPATNTLYVSGKGYKVCEIEIPEAINSPNMADLNIAEFVQPWGDPTGGIRSTFSAQVGQGVRLGDVMVYGDWLLWTIYPYYSETNCPSHGISKLDLANPQAKGPYLIGQLRPAHYAGYLELAPEGWPFPVITGQSGLAVVNRTGTGPAVHNFDPAILTGEPANIHSYDNGEAPSHAVTYLDYPNGDNRFMPDLFDHTGKPVNAYPNRPVGAITTPKATVQIVYRGKGDYWYGGGSGPEGQTDPCSSNQGVHTEGTELVAMFFDNAELLKAGAGEIPTYEPRPYAERILDDHPRLVERQHWTMTRMVPCVAGHATYDRSRQRLYIAQAEGDRTNQSNALQLIHVFRADF